MNYVKNESYFIQDGLVYMQQVLTTGGIGNILIGNEVIERNEGIEEDPALVKYVFNVNSGKYEKALNEEV